MRSRERAQENKCRNCGKESRAARQEGAGPSGVACHDVSTMYAETEEEGHTTEAGRVASGTIQVTADEGPRQWAEDTGTGPPWGTTAVGYYRSWYIKPKKRKAAAENDTRSSGLVCCECTELVGVVENPEQPGWAFCYKCWPPSDEEAGEEMEAQWCEVVEEEMEGQSEGDQVQSEEDQWSEMTEEEQEEEDCEETPFNAVV